MNSPRLTTRPARVIRIALERFTFQWLLSNGIEVERVIGREIISDNMFR